MLGYSYFLPELISYFSIYDVGFYGFIVFTQFKYSFIKIRLPKTIFPFRKGDIAKQKHLKFLMVCVAL